MIAVLLITAPDCGTITRNQGKKSLIPPFPSVPIAKPFFRQYGVSSYRNLIAIIHAAMINNTKL